jgi:hypothetical protein
MAGTGGLRRIGALLVIALVVGLYSVALAGTAPPHNGPWAMRAYSFGVDPKLKPIDEVTGSFKVSGGKVSDVKAVTGTGNHSGCNAHVQLRSIGTATIKHATGSSGAVDYFWVGTGTELWEKVKFRELAPGSKHWVKNVASLRIYFPRGVGDFDQGFGTGDLQVTGKAVGVLCNLNFDVR